MDKSIKANKVSKLSISVFEFLGFTYKVTKEKDIKKYELIHNDADMTVNMCATDVALVIDVVKKWNESSLHRFSASFGVDGTKIDVTTSKGVGGLLSVLQSMK